MTDDLPRRIREVRKRLGMNQAQFAAFAKVSQGSVSKWEAGKEVPSLNSLMELFVKTGEPLHQLWGGPQRDLDESSASSYIKIVGRIESGLFVESIAFDVQHLFNIPLPRFVGVLDLEGYLVVGDDGGPDYPDRSLVMVARSSQYRLRLEEGDVVVAMQTSEHELLEASLRRYSMYKGEVWLWSMSTNPERQAALKVASDAESQAGVEIFGQVVACIRPTVADHREFEAWPKPPRPPTSDG